MVPKQRNDPRTLRSQVSRFASGLQMLMLGMLVCLSSIIRCNTLGSQVQYLGVHIQNLCHPACLDSRLLCSILRSSVLDGSSIR